MKGKKEANLAIVLFVIGIVLTLVGFYNELPFIKGNVFDKFFFYLGSIAAAFFISWLVYSLVVKIFLKEKRKVFFGMVLVLIAFITTRPLEGRKDRFIQKCVVMDHLSVEECELKFPSYERIEGEGDLEKEMIKAFVVDCTSNTVSPSECKCVAEKMIEKFGMEMTITYSLVMKNKGIENVDPEFASFIKTEAQDLCKGK